MNLSSKLPSKNYDFILKSYVAKPFLTSGATSGDYPRYYNQQPNDGARVTATKLFEYVAVCCCWLGVGCKSGCNNRAADTITSLIFSRGVVADDC
jgi:hypothetical protein